MFNKIIFFSLIFFLTSAHALDGGRTFNSISSISEEQNIIKDYLLYREAIKLEDTDIEGALNIYLKIIESYKGTPNYKKALRRILHIKQKRDEEDVINYINIYNRDFPSDTEELYKASRYLVRKNEIDKAIELIKNIISQVNGYSVKAIKTLDELGFTISDSDRINLIKKLFDRRLFEEIVELKKIFSPLREVEEIYFIKSLFRTRRYKEVIENIKEFKTPEYLELYLLSHLRNGQRELFINRVRELLKEKNKNYFTLYITLSDILKNQGELEEALNILLSLEELFPDKKELIYWNQALIYIRLNNYSKAERLLENLSRTSSSDRYYYWLGKINEYQERDGEKFYSLLGENDGYYYLKKKKPLIRNIKTADQKKLPRVDALLNLGMKDEAREELLFSIKDNGACCIDYFQKLELYYNILMVGEKIGNLYLKYPPAYMEIIKEKSAGKNIDPFLVMAIAREESHFRKDVVSPAKAYGLMQIILPTARRYNHVVTVSDLFREDKNIEIGISYLDFLLKKFGSVEYAVAAYNAGEHNVIRWLENTYRDMDEFIENIPFLETRNYVKKVMRSYYIYRSLYEKP